MNQAEKPKEETQKKDKDGGIVVGDQQVGKVDQKAISESLVKADSGKGFRVDLENEDGAGYVGTVFLGSD